MQDSVFARLAENLETIHAQVLLLNRLVEDLRTLSVAQRNISLTIADNDLGKLLRDQWRPIIFFYVLPVSLCLLSCASYPCL